MKALDAPIATILLLILAGVPQSSAQEPTETIDFFTTNVVSTRFEQEGPDDGVKHLARQSDGRTTLENLDGVPCRYLNRAADGKTFGYLYFTIHPDFKARELKTARIEVEYKVINDSLLRLQYDAIVGDDHKPYKGVVAQEGSRTKLAPTAEYARIRGTNAWQKATFYIADGAFKNSQNGKADFRLEVMPPEIYVRRVTVTREDVAPPPPPK